MHNLAASYPQTITDSHSSSSSLLPDHTKPSSSQSKLNTDSINLLQQSRFTNQKEKKMSVASSPSFPCIKLPTPSSPAPSSYSPPPSSSSSAAFKFTIRNAQADGPLRRPGVPTPVKPVPPSSPSPPAAPPAASPPPAAAQPKNVVTLEFQRQKAKELQEYFKQKKLEAVDQAPFFGFIAKNEISNGRWAMFGFAVGLLTEFATGSDFVDQVKILLSNFGILDLE